MDTQGILNAVFDPTVLALRVMGGVELDYGEAIATQQQTNSTAVTGCTIDFTVGSRPVWVVAYGGYLSNSVNAANTQIFITDAANAIIRRGIVAQATGLNSQIGSAYTQERITTPGVYNRKLRFASSSATANSASIMVANLGHAFIAAFEV